MKLLRLAIPDSKYCFQGLNLSFPLFLLVTAFGCDCPPFSDCSGSELTDVPYQDADSDGYSPEEGDCDDWNREAYPGALETCDGVDQDCDGVVDNDPTNGAYWFPDTDGDTYGSYEGVIQACDNPDGYVDNYDDCDDQDPQSYSGADEICGDDKDNDCDDSIDEDPPLWYEDPDGDGYGYDDSAVASCEQPEGLVALGGDCDETSAENHPGVVELCNDGIDNNCDGFNAHCGIEGELDTNEADVILIGDYSDDHAGQYVSVGDQNGDGFFDLLIGAHGVNSFESTDKSTDKSSVRTSPSTTLPDPVPGQDTGRAYLQYGPVFGSHELKNAEDVIVGLETGNNLGAGVSMEGDLNGDGQIDIAVDVSDKPADEVVLFYHPIVGSVEYTKADSLVYGNDDEEAFGISLATAGDLNGDDLPDLVVGASTNERYGELAGAVFVFYSPFTDHVTSADPDANAEIYAANGWAHLGKQVSTSGDLNNDGFADLVISAPQDSSVECFAGKVYVFFGPLRGAHMASDADVIISSTHYTENFGDKISSGGDANGDGIDDLLIGSNDRETYCYGGTDPLEGKGQAYLFYGPLPGGEIDADEADLVFQGEHPDDRLGHGVSLGGDYDNDGADDMIIGASGYPEGDITGVAYLFYGPILEGRELSSADAKILGAEISTGFGGLINYGDTNGDGYDDAVISAASCGESCNGGGKVYVFFGGPRSGEE